MNVKETKVLLEGNESFAQEEIKRGAEVFMFLLKIKIRIDERQGTVLENVMDSG